MLNLTNSPIILCSLLTFMSFVTRGNAVGLVRRSVGIKHPYIKKCSFKPASLPPPPPPPPPKQLATTSSRALSSVLALRVEKDSPLSGWRWGSMETSWQTSVSKLAKRSRTSLCRIMVNPPVGQESACSMVNKEP